MSLRAVEELISTFEFYDYTERYLLDSNQMIVGIRHQEIDENGKEVGLIEVTWNGQHRPNREYTLKIAKDDKVITETFLNRNKVHEFLFQLDFLFFDKNLIDIEMYLAHAFIEELDYIELLDKFTERFKINDVAQGLYDLIDENELHDYVLEQLKSLSIDELNYMFNLTSRLEDDIIYV